MSVTIDLPADAQARLEGEAARRGITLAQLIIELAAALPVEDPLEAFIGCGASTITEPFDIHRERAELATKKLAQGV